MEHGHSVNGRNIVNRHVVHTHTVNRHIHNCACMLKFWKFGSTDLMLGRV